jgi:NAD(P)-dependent dehydrogenase (short-subunit alcohol dehydrogenase family)
MILGGRVAIVTGAGSGIGRAGALALARQGAAVVAADRDAEAGEETSSLIRAARGESLAVATDVSDDGQIAALITRTADSFGRIDILHSHAGIQVEGTLEQVDPGGESI